MLKKHAKVCAQALCEKNEILPSKVKMRFRRVFFNTDKSLIEAIEFGGRGYVSLLPDRVSTRGVNVSKWGVSE